MKRKTKSKRKEKVKTVAELFPDEWVAGLRDNIRGMEELELDRPEHSFSRSAKLSAAYFCFAILAWYRHNKQQRLKILLDTEKLHNRFGVSLFANEPTVSRCLTEKHEECMGSYVSVFVKGHIECRCSCHNKKPF